MACVLLPYQVSSTSKLEEIHGKENKVCTKEKVDTFSDSDWAGNKPNTLPRRHSISSGMVFATGGLETAWSRTQKSIALFSCESKDLAAASAGSEACALVDSGPFLPNVRQKSAW